MNTNEIRSSLKKILTEFRAVENELNRPKEDVVPLSLCYGMRRMMKSMMQLYLLSNKVEHTELKSMSELLDGCKSLNQQFASVSLSGIPCTKLDNSECDDKYCLSIEKAKECLSVAHLLKAVIMAKLQVSEIEIV